MAPMTLETEIAEVLANAHRPLLETIKPAPTEVGEAIAAFVIQRTDALEAVVLRLAREVDALKGA